MVSCSAPCCQRRRQLKGAQVRQFRLLKRCHRLLLYCPRCQRRRCGEQQAQWGYLQVVLGPELEYGAASGRRVAQPATEQRACTARSLDEVWKKKIWQDAIEVGFIDRDRCGGFGAGFKRIIHISLRYVTEFLRYAWVRSVASWWRSSGWKCASRNASAQARRQQQQGPRDINKYLQWISV